MRLGLSFSSGAMLSLVLLCCGINPVPAGGMPASVPFDGREVEVTEVTGHACIALAVFSVAPGASYLEQAAVVTVIRNRMAAIDEFADPCTTVYGMDEFEALRRWEFPRAPWDLDPVAWQMAVDVTDAVMTGNYTIAPPHCARATAFHRADVAPMVTGDGLPPGRTPLPSACAIGAHVFSGPSPDSDRALITAAH